MKEGNYNMLTVTYELLVDMFDRCGDSDMFKGATIYDVRVDPSSRTMVFTLSGPNCDKRPEGAAIVNKEVRLKPKPRTAVSPLVGRRR